MYSEVFVLFIAMNPVFIYIFFCTLLCRLHSFLSFRLLQEDETSFYSIV